jgi:hypothetical protein
MRRFEHKEGHINYNLDLSGEVKIVNIRGEEFWVSGEMLRDFVNAVGEKNKEKVPDVKHVPGTEVIAGFWV